MNSRPAEPCRPEDAARLSLAKLRIEDGIELETVFQRVTEAAADVLEVERVGVWLLAEERRALRCANLFERSKRMHSAGTTLQTDEFPEYFAAIERRKTVPAENAKSDPRTSGLTEAYLRPLGITSLLDASIWISGEVVGILCHEHTGPPREWTTEQRDFAGSMADLLAMKMQSAEAEELRVALRSQASQIAEARRVSALAETAAGIAHDFNNLLSVMLTAAELIATEPNATPEIVQLAREIAGAGLRGEALARGLIEFSQPPARSSRIVRPADVISSALDLLQTAAGNLHPVDLEIRSGASRVLIDPHRLERLVLNLVVNARDAMPEGGKIGLLVDTGSEAQLGTARGEYAVISVSDSGTGIPPAVLSRIFDPFFTTKPKGRGTGIGLAVVQEISNYAGGFVRVESSVGEGTTFRAYLPRASSS